MCFHILYFFPFAGSIRSLPRVIGDFTEALLRQLGFRGVRCEYQPDESAASHRVRLGDVRQCDILYAILMKEIALVRLQYVAHFLH